MLGQYRRAFQRLTWTRVPELPSLRPLSDSCQPKSSQHAIAHELKYSAHNYSPLPVVLCKGEGVHVWDPEGKQYLDFLSGYGALNLGHCHPQVLDTFRQQAGLLHHTSRAFYSDLLGEYSQYITHLFSFDKVLPMNTGVEACETAMKLARKWGYIKKGIPRDQAVLIFARDNFCGRSIAAVSASTDPTSYGDYGPFVPGFDWVPYDDLPTLEEKLQNPNVCGFMVEPIQGEAGIVVPSDGYLTRVRELCTKHNVLMIADEVQTGLGRTGRMLAVDHEGVKPDILVLGKALSAGFYPVSAVLANNDVMLVMKPGTHGSTFGGNPLGCKVAMKTLQIIQDDKLSENAQTQGELFRSEMAKLSKNVIECVRGKGLFNSIVIHEKCNHTAWNICLKLKENGLLCKPTHDNIIRFTPPLVINEQQMSQAVAIISKTFQQL